jgi:hypothetical protein
MATRMRGTYSEGDMKCEFEFGQVEYRRLSQGNGDSMYADLPGNAGRMRGRMTDAITQNN